MRCPFCGSYNTTVTDTRKKLLPGTKIDTVYRRHKCECKMCFTTYEHYAKEELQFIKNNSNYKKVNANFVSKSRMGNVIESG